MVLNMPKRFRGQLSNIAVEILMFAVLVMAFAIVAIIAKNVQTGFTASGSDNLTLSGIVNVIAAITDAIAYLPNAILVVVIVAILYILFKVFS